MKQQRPHKAMVLAAGRGERMRPLTDHTPKPLLTVAGKPLIVWHLERLARSGVTDIVINVSWLANQIEQALADGKQYGVNISYSHEPWPALETGGGIAQALALLGPNPFLLVNADVFTDIDFAALTLPAGDRAHLVLVPNPPHNLKGDFFLDTDQRIQSDAGERLTYSGIAVIDPALLKAAVPGRFPLLPWLNRARDQGRLSGTRHLGRWLDIGTPQRLSELDAELSTMQPSSA